VNADAAANSNDGQRDWAAPRRFALLLGALIAIPFWDVFLGLRTFILRDYGVYSYPVAYFLRQAFWHRELPLWNPYSYCGVPFLAQLNTLALYPGSLFYLLLPLTWALGVFCLLHIFLAGMGMYFLAARWTGSRPGAALAGIVFAFNGLALNFVMWPSHLATYAWMPWVLLLVEQGWSASNGKLFLAAFAGGMEILAGGPEEILFTWLLLGLLFLARLRAQPSEWLTVTRRFLTMGLLAGGVAAAQLLPFADLVTHSNRDTHYGDSAWSMPPWGWGNFLVPLFQTSKWQSIVVQRDQYWTSSYYAGIGVVFLAAMALWRVRKPRIWLLGALLLASIVLALGNNGYVFPWVKRLLPFLGMFRYPVKFVILTMIVIAPLTAFALAHYANRKQVLQPGEMTAAGVILLLIAVILWVARYWPVENTSWAATLANALERAGFLALTLAALCLFVARPQWRAWSIVPLLLICWADLMTHMPWQNPTIDPSIFQPGLGQMSDQLNPVPAIDQSRLMMSPYATRQLYYKPASGVRTNYVLDRAVFLADCNLLDELPKVDGFFSLNSRDSDKVLWLLDSRGGKQLDTLEDFLSVSQTIAPGKVFDWVPRTNYIPIVSIGQEPVFTTHEAAFAAIANNTGDFRSEVYLPLEAKSAVKAHRQPAARVISKNFTLNRRAIEVKTPTPAMLVLSETFYHNWTAQLDGKPAPLWRANYAFEAVEVPAGRHSVLLVYKDKAFVAGAIISLFATLFCCTGYVFTRNTR
jgi:hypothetical protein